MSISIIKYISIVLSVLGILYLGYDKVYSIGYNKASVEYEVKLKEYDDKLRDRINNIEVTSTIILEEYTKGRVAAAIEYKNILSAAKTKPLVIYQDGKCEISPDFSKAYSEALKRANRK